MILVTGGAGFIGSHLLDALICEGREVVCFDNFNNFYDPAIKRLNIAGHVGQPGFHLVEGDICDMGRLSEVFRKYNITRIVHLAARAGVRPSVEQPALYNQVNVEGTINLLELARTHQIEQFVFASSSSVYGASTKVPFSEADKIDCPVSPYAATKFAGELMCYTYHHLYGIPVTALRFFTAYGPRQRPEMAIHKFTRLIYEGKPIPLFGQGGTARDYTYIDDIVQGLLAAIDFSCEYEVFNLGESSTITLINLVRLIEQISAKPARIDFQPSQPGDVEITYADISKARRLLGYRPSTPIEDGLTYFISWFSEYEALRSAQKVS